MASRAKIVLLIPTLDRSGAEKQLTLLATGLPRDEFDVHVVALTRGGPFEAELRAADIPVTVLGKRFKFDPLAYTRLSALLKNLKPDLLHTWLFAANSYGRLAAGRHPGYPVVVSERCVDVWKAGWQLRFDRWLIPRTTRLVGNSNAVVEFYRRLGYPAERLVAIPNGLDPRPLPEIDRPGELSALNLPPLSRVIVSVGRLARQKRVRDVIWAFELVRLLHNNVVLLIVGDGPERARLEEFARAIEVHDRVRFLGHQQDVTRWLALGDVFCLASDFEGQPNSLMEAMGAGIPVVATDIPANRELVEPGRHGLLVPVGDGVAMQKATLQLLQNAGLATMLGRAARDRICLEFSVDAMIGRYADLYRSLMGGSAPAARTRPEPVTA